jgi:hypothetical protein
LRSTAPARGDRIAAGVIFGILILLSAGGWRLFNRNRFQLETRRTDIVSRPSSKTATGAEGRSGWTAPTATRRWR